MNSNAPWHVRALGRRRQSDSRRDGYECAKYNQNFRSRLRAITITTILLGGAVVFCLEGRWWQWILGIAASIVVATFSAYRLCKYQPVLDEEEIEEREKLRKERREHLKMFFAGAAKSLAVFIGLALLGYLIYRAYKAF